MAENNENFLIVPESVLKSAALSEKTLSFNKSIFEYIDSLDDVDSVKSAGAWIDEKRLKKIFWESFKKYFAATSDLEKRKAALKCAYINNWFGSSIPFNRHINRFITPHAFYGIFISNSAKIGKDCVIFQNVTIGSNTLLDSKSAGVPVIGDKVYIGAGAQIIGNVKVGNNVRIGAGCTVTKDVPDNSTIMQSTPVIIQKKTLQDNRWVSISDFKKIKAEQSKNSPPPQRLLNARYIRRITANFLFLRLKVQKLFIGRWTRQPKLNTKMLSRFCFAAI